MQKTIYSHAQQKVADWLRAARLDAGLTQQELAKRLTRPQSFVAKYETGQRRLDIVEFAHIARILKADAAAIFRVLKD